MPRARCHWALLLRTRDALAAHLAPERNPLLAHRDAFLAGGAAPDALRLFGGQDKLSTHFYDDQDEATWGRMAETMCAAHPTIADATRLSPAALAWMIGYLSHLAADVAYWRHVITKLPPFPQHIALHHGAWIMADSLAIAPHERSLDVTRAHFDGAPPWVSEVPVRTMLERVNTQVVIPEDRWLVELVYLRSYPSAAGRSDSELLAEYVPRWEANLAQAQSALPPEAWAAFYADAVAGSTETVLAYLECAGSAS